ncbi:lipopolysaccharide biosynthesis protein [Algoriphagus halophilus]|uniref:Membrane protein involved in the export of O-antigen and teichoic acid n=1 Tax=Algoriphagus halophilus TaxID=226505 RepID=A0A1N6EEL0_9BACT|nr:lipopolysaccharide biosynthesis protein [Algoriphagus halophilus]SIN81454.1 Membrane protein involved in the export of O-antigen and teichoic acid [Algoriphagus halophilus]
MGQKKIIKGVFWNALQLIINKSFAFIIKLILAKLLVPEEFGVVGMAIVFISFVEVFNDLGFGAALIQKKETDYTPNLLYTAFWTNLGWSLLTYLAVAFIVAPLAASFYEEPVLLQIIPVMSVGIISNSIIVIHKVQLTRIMDFKKMAIISNISNVFSGVLSITLALLGAGYWSLVFNSVAGFIVAIPLFMHATKWTPKFIWEKEDFNKIFGFGFYFTGTKFFNNLITKIDYLLIGKWVGAYYLGIYTFAFILTDTFRSQVLQIINKVMFPVYSTIQDNPAEIKKNYLNVLKYNSMIISPIMAVFVVLGEEVIRYGFGEKWLEAVFPLKIISLSILIHMMANSYTVLLRGIGRADVEFKLQLFKAVFIFIPMLTIGIYYYGINGASIAILINKSTEVVIGVFILKRFIGLDYREVFAFMKKTWFFIVAMILIGILSREVLGLHYFITFILMAVVYLFGLKGEIKKDIKHFSSLKSS